MEIYDKAHELAGVIQDCEEYKALLAAGEKLNSCLLYTSYPKMELKKSGYLTYLHSNMDFFGYSWDNK